MTPHLEKQGFRLRFSPISLAVLAAVLIAAPATAAPEKADKSDKPAASKTAPAKDKVALRPSVSDDSAKSGKDEKSTPARTTTTKTTSTTKAKAKTEIASTDTKTSTKTALAKTSKSKTELAATDKKASTKSDTAKTKTASGRTETRLADSTPAKTTAGTPKVTTTTKAPASPVKVVMDLSKAAPVAEAKPVDATPPLNAAPVPYQQVAAASPPPSPATVPVDAVLSDADAQLYRSAFASIDDGDFDDAERSLAQVSDKSLLGYAEYHKLFSRSYTSTYAELTTWLDAYGDLPMAMNVWSLAKRKKPKGSDDPAFPSLGRTLPGQATKSINDDNPAVELAAYATLDAPLQTAPNAGPGIDDGADLTPKSARSAYNNDQLEQAVTLGRTIGDHWVAGLALWRLNRFEQAEAEFKFISTDPSRNAWSQSGGAYWAGRCALKQGHEDDAGTYFRIAASFPFTFYGLVAEQRLGVTPAVTLSKKGQAPTFGGMDRTALSASLDGDFSWTHGNAQAVRLNALVQIGRDIDAQRELQGAIQSASDGGERDRWLALAAKTHVPVSQLKPADRLFDATKYPMPDYDPKGGYRIDRALIYAFARKESKFNPKAHSYSGAYGLLQLMPATAAIVTGDSSFNSKPSQLLAPAVNLKVGQDYIQRLSDSAIMDGDLLRTIGAYNAGPRPIKDAVDSLGPDADSLLMMESIPVAQTRQYVEEVAANYWIYRQLMGKPSQTLAMAAADAKILDASADK